ncbi:MAG: hypothetical protein RL648_1510, partial [Verrucomicrobiota bacterium]
PPALHGPQGTSRPLDAHYPSCLVSVFGFFRNRQKVIPIKPQNASSAKGFSPKSNRLLQQGPQRRWIRPARYQWSDIERRADKGLRRYHLLRGGLHLPLGGGLFSPQRGNHQHGPVHSDVHRSPHFGALRRVRRQPYPRAHPPTCHRPSDPCHGRPHHPQGALLTQPLRQGPQSGVRVIRRRASAAPHLCSWDS